MSLKNKIKNRDPMMDLWGDDISLGGTKNQRDNDHDDIQAERHCREIDNKVSHKNLITPNFVIDEDLEIDFGGTITLRLIDLDRGLWLTSDGLSRNVKIFLLGLTLRDECDDKSIFDKYMFRKGTKEIRLKLMNEVGVFVSPAYRQINDIIAQLLLRKNKIEYIIEDNFDESLYNQNYYVIKQLGAYSKWVKNHNFKSDEERLTVFENILNLYRVVFTRSINDVNSFMNNSDEVGVPTNGISAIANKVLTHIQNKYCSKSNQNDFINETINEQIKFIFSPIRMRVPPTKEMVVESTSWVIQSYYMTPSGKDKDGTVMNTVANEICNLLDIEIDKYGDKDDDKNIYVGSKNKDILIHLETVLKTWHWHNDLKSINRYFDNGIIRSGGTRWIPLLLKYEREKRRELNSVEIRAIQMFHIFGKFVAWKKYRKLLGHAVNDIDKDTELMDLLVKYFVNDSKDKDGEVIEEINFKSQLLDNYILAKGKDSDSDPNNKYYKYIDRLLSKLMLKGNIQNWVNIDPYEVGDIENEHFLARLYHTSNGDDRSDVRLRGSNFMSLDKSTNGYISNDDIDKKIKVIAGSDTSFGQLFEPNGRLEKPVSDLLNSSEYDVFRQDGFSNKEWIKIASVGVIGDNQKINLSKNLIWRYRSVQLDTGLYKKVFKI